MKYINKQKMVHYWVAPLVGAWIEIEEQYCHLYSKIVAPLVGAWIEIAVTDKDANGKKVAPLVGAWIEILFLCNNLGIRRSLLSWERGLKFHCKYFHMPGNIPSLLSWERGLKYRNYSPYAESTNVAPLVGAWIEMIVWNRNYFFRRSLLSWERGLKYCNNSQRVTSIICRSSRGSVD